MKFFKNLRRRAAIIFVTLWAKLAYEEGVRAAENRRRKSDGEMIYLAKNSFRPDHLVTYDKEQFKIEKRVYGVAARLLTMNTLKTHCYYHTADRFGNNALSSHERETRKKAFIKERLHLAKLL